EPCLLRLSRAAAHRLVLLDRVGHVGQVHAPALGHEDAELQVACGHALIVGGQEVVEGGGAPGGGPGHAAGGTSGTGSGATGAVATCTAGWRTGLRSVRHVRSIPSRNPTAMAV